MSTIAGKAHATGAWRCKVLDFDGNCVRIVKVNADDLEQARINTRNAGYRLLPIAQVSEDIRDIRNTNRHGREI
jgi:hypothetical protein